MEVKEKSLSTSTSSAIEELFSLPFESHYRAKNSKSATYSSDLFCCLKCSMQVKWFGLGKGWTDHGALIILLSVGFFFKLFFYFQRTMQPMCWHNLNRWFWTRFCWISCECCNIDFGFIFSVFTSLICFILFQGNAITCQKHASGNVFRWSNAISFTFFSANARH